jgi:hypothetical protein
VLKDLLSCLSLVALANPILRMQSALHSLLHLFTSDRTNRPWFLYV